MKNKLSKISLILGLLLVMVIPSQAQLIIKQSTNTTVDIFLRDTTTGNGKTGVAATSIACDLAKQSDTTSSSKTTFTAAASGSSNDAVEIAHGLYNLELSSGNTDTLGRLYLVCQCTNAYDFRGSYEVVASGAYDVNVTGNVTTAAAVATAVWAAMTSTTLAELTGVPSGTPSLDQAIMLLYMAARNELTVTASQKSIKNDAGTIVVKKTLSSAAGTFTETEAVSGP